MDDTLTIILGIIILLLYVVSFKIIFEKVTTYMQTKVNDFSLSMIPALSILLLISAIGIFILEGRMGIVRFFYVGGIIAAVSLIVLLIMYFIVRPTNKEFYNKIGSKFKVKN